MPFRHSPRGDWQPDTPPDLSAYDTVFLDAETDGLEWYAGKRPVGWAVRAGGRSWYLPFAHRGGGNLDEATVRRWAQRELRGKRIVNLNTRFDCHMARAWGVDLAEQGCTFRDVAHSAALLDDWRRGFSLEALAQDALKIGKLDAGPKTEIALMPAWDIAPYAQRDVELVDALYQAYAPQLTAQDLDRVQALEDAVIPAVVEMEHNGCPLDMALLHQWVESSGRTLEDLLWEISREVGFSVNPDSNADVFRVHTALGIPIVAYTEKGQPSFTEAAMKAANHPTLTKILRAGKLTDLRNKFLLPYQKLAVNGVLYATFHQLMTGEGGTVSGRFSCVRPNLQQVMTPGKQKKNYGEFGGETYIVKQLFRPAQGVWFAADAKQIEYRLFGHYAENPSVLAAYREDPDADYHDIVAGLIRPHKADIERKSAKDVNFASLYGAGASKIAAMLGMDGTSATQFLDVYHGLFPEVRTLQQATSNVASSRGYVKTVMGRRARYPKRERLHTALNRIIQGGAADLNKLTLVEVFNERKNLGLTMRLTVHDEIDGDLADAAMLPAVQEVLDRQRVPLKIPILWDARVGASWADAK